MRGHLARRAFWVLVIGGLTMTAFCAPKVEFDGEGLPGHCSNGAQDLDETDLDCGGSCDRCGNGERCLEANDCRIGSCVSGLCQAAHCLDGEVTGDESDSDCGGACTPCKIGQQCKRDADCVSDVCDASNGTCVPGSCDDGKQNGDETDVDCGGADCDPCASELGCSRDVDCVSGTCTAGICRGSVCDDGKQNGDETDIDCGGTVCSPCGLKAQCGEDRDCASELCRDEACIDAGCLDAEKNGDETDEDCGGEACTGCDAGQACLANTDCSSLVCQDDLCLAPECDDRVVNGAESDVDCGGTCDPCPDAASCETASDCASGVCEEGICQEPACDDEVPNQDETDTDCGGSCDGCQAGRRCLEPSDCETGYCVTEVCAAVECTNGVLDGTETDADCGGPLCPGCAAGKACTNGSDCKSHVCDADDTCAAPSCEDAFRNGEETGVNCGGPDCEPCGVGESCLVPEDCVSRSCQNGACAPPDCNDEVQNGVETDQDCGGAQCGGCDDGLSCELGTDCKSLRCGPPYAPAATCATPACGDGVRNGAETDQDCGGDCPSKCGPNKRCLEDADCTTGFCDPDTDPRVCVAPGCGDGTENGFETDVDCGGEECAPCARYFSCDRDSDCISGNCSDAGTCDLASCTNGKVDGSESDIDCGGSCPQQCAGGQLCDAASDCASAVCTDNPIGPGTTCKNPTCDDGVRNQGESDIDCGIAECGGCGTSQACTSHSHCVSSHCDTSVDKCLEADCSDSITNGDESDTDCGGGCPACDVGDDCNGPSDCSDLVCTEGTCRTHSCDPPDGASNGNETGVDCGGPGCPDCPNGQWCLGNSDCLSSYCEDNFCTEPGCNDGARNGSETDTDCGGSDCSRRCDTNQDCREGSDCSSRVCSGGTCRAPSCDPPDGAANGNETDEDCGGPSCPPCADGRFCEEAADCMSGVCPMGTLTCSVPQCNDGVKNGTETDIDCGYVACGGIPKLCLEGQGCGGDQDCQSDICDAGVCTAPGCEDGRSNQGESDVDCGGLTTCVRCPDDKLCNSGSDCLSGYCAVTGFCKTPSCHDAWQNQDETDLNCGGTVCSGCGVGDRCNVGGDCTSGFCNPDSGECALPTCSDTFKNQGETGVDCGGPACRSSNPCEDGEQCAIDADCTDYANSNGRCSGGECTYECVSEDYLVCTPETPGCDSVSNDEQHCGACHHVCGTAHTTSSQCLSGACSLTCVDGWEHCDGSDANGCETNVSENAMHCGSCNNACGDDAVGELCREGQCCQRIGASHTNPSGSIPGTGGCFRVSPARCDCGMVVQVSTTQEWRVVWDIDGAEELVTLGGNQNIVLGTPKSAFTVFVVSGNSGNLTSWNSGCGGTVTECVDLND